MLHFVGKNVEKKDVKVHMLRRDVILFDPITRKLINESNGTFLAGQKLAGKASQNEIRSELLKLSRQYRYCDTYYINYFNWFFLLKSYFKVL